MPNVLIADDNRGLRRGLKILLDKTDDIVVTGEAGDGQEALDMISTNRYDLVLLDISMPGKNGFEVLREMKFHKPDLPVIMLSSFPAELYAARTLAGGASGYLEKDRVSDELVSAITKIFNKKRT